MRAVIQRVANARVDVEGERVGEMEAGLLSLVGVEVGDDARQAEDLARKIVHLRIFEDESGRMNRSLLDTGGTLGIVSQFTLLADCRKGRRPSWGQAEAPEKAAPLIERVVQAAREEGVMVITGRFQAHMSVALLNDGPVTVLLDTRKRF